MNNIKTQKFIAGLIGSSFTSSGLNIKKVKKIVSLLKKLPKGEAVSSLSLYLKLLKHQLDAHRLIIETPIPLSKYQLDGIYKLMSQNSKVFETEVRINENLLGGFRIMLGDFVYEDSIEDRIEQVRRVIRS